MQHPDQEKWCMIVNPNAGVKKGLKDWPRILELLKSEGIDFESFLTESRGHAIRLTAEAVDAGYRNFCVVGGDGTLNEVLNGLMSVPQINLSDMAIAMIPVGTGNDWCRQFSIPFDYRDAIRVLKRKSLFVQDIARVTYAHHGKQEVRWFMNVAGMGYDALVAKKTNLLKERGVGGPLTYMYFVFASLFQFKFMEAVIEVDGETVFKGEIFSMNVGICKFSGGGMMQVPHAVPDDGLLDVTLIKKAPKWIVIRYAHKLYDGSLIDLPMVATWRGKNIRIRSVGDIFLETDGESLGHTPFVFEVQPERVKIVSGL